MSSPPASLFCLISSLLPARSQTHLCAPCRCRSLHCWADEFEPACYQSIPRPQQNLPLLSDPDTTQMFLKHREGDPAHRGAERDVRTLYCCIWPVLTNSWACCSPWERREIGRRRCWRCLAEVPGAWLPQEVIRRTGSGLGKPSEPQRALVPGASGR